MLRPDFQSTHIELVLPMYSLSLPPLLRSKNLRLAVSAGGRPPDKNLRLAVSPDSKRT